MVKSVLSFILSSLRWINWLIQYAVVYPLAMMMLLIVAESHTRADAGEYHRIGAARGICHQGLHGACFAR
ncbi:conjugal transfer protein TraP [Klebsiella michiganensis]|uniref:conjugal transfer protein TraP n=1 Tax=Klebsiella michiganensis TaxID=1134687 RepID=UPI002180D7AA|nr:conjugal transfer protein TraP [Klebsiella michiganensis]MDV0363499.1 conjugal transfer protein TraP [Klebsiella michiganensis]